MQFSSVLDIMHSLDSFSFKCVVEPEKLMRGCGNDQRCKMASVQEQPSMRGLIILEKRRQSDDMEFCKLRNAVGIELVSDRIERGGR